MMLQSNMSRAILTRSDQSSNQISLANFFIYNTEFGQKEGRVRDLSVVRKAFILVPSFILLIYKGS